MHMSTGQSQVLLCSSLMVQKWGTTHDHFLRWALLKNNRRLSLQQLMLRAVTSAASLPCTIMLNFILKA